MALADVDFELALRGAGDAYQAEVRLDYGADSILYRGPFPVNIDPLLLNGEAGSPAAYGDALSKMLFADPALRETLAAARGIAQGRPQPGPVRLRLLLGPGAEPLHSLRWELLCLPGQAERLTTREDILFSRFLPGAASAALPAPKTALTALAAVAAPRNAREYGLAAIDPTAEQARARAGLAGISLDFLPGSASEHCTLNRLAASIPGKEVLYLVCHGKLIAGSAWLLLEDEQGSAARVSAADLAHRLTGTLNLPRLAILVVCESAGQGSPEMLGALGPRLVAAGIPAVLAMHGALSFPSAELFLPPLFQALRQDGCIDRAVSIARRAIQGQPDEAAPVLFMSLKSGQLWAPASPQAQPGPSAASNRPPNSAAPIDPVRLYHVLSGEAFTLEDLEALCFTLGVDWELLRGQVKPAKARAMLQYFTSRGRLAELAAAVRAERPNLEF